MRSAGGSKKMLTPAANLPRPLLPPPPTHPPQVYKALRNGVQPVAVKVIPLAPSGRSPDVVLQVRRGGLGAGSGFRVGGGSVLQVLRVLQVRRVQSVRRVQRVWGGPVWETKASGTGPRPLSNISGSGAPGLGTCLSWARSWGA